MSTQVKNIVSEFRGNKLRGLRLERELSQTELAEKAGISKQMISQMEKGGPMGIKTASKLANFYKIDVQWLMEEEYSLESYKRHLIDPGRKVGVKKREVTLESRFDFFEDRVTQYIMTLEGKVEDLMRGREKLLEEMDDLKIRIEKLESKRGE